MPKLTRDYIDSLGITSISPWMIGEQLERTVAALHEALQKSEIATPKPEQTWEEPSIHAPSRSMDTVVFQSKNGGNSIVMNDPGSDGTGHMLIVHKSGSVFQIDSNGTILIKSVGDTHNNTEGLHYQRSSGDTNMNVGGEWNVKVEVGSGNVFINGDLNIECENFNVTARAKATINAAEAIQMKGAKFSLEAHADNFDLVGKNFKLGASESISILGKEAVYVGSESSIQVLSKDVLNIQGKNVSMLSDEATKIQAAGGALDLKSSENANLEATGGEIHLKASADGYFTTGGQMDLYGAGDVYIDGPFVRLAEGAFSASGAADAEAAENGVLPEPVELPEPPERRPATNTAAGVSTVSPTPPAVTGHEADDDDADATGANNPEDPDANDPRGRDQIPDYSSTTLGTGPR